MLKAAKTPQLNCEFELIQKEESPDQACSTDQVDDEQTRKHGLYHTWKVVVCSILLVICAVCYVMYGVDRINHAKAHPSTRTELTSIATYDVPMIYTCPNSEKYGSIHPWQILLSDHDADTGRINYTLLCLPGSSGYLAQHDLVSPQATYESYTGSNGVGRAKHRCEDLVSDEYTNRSAWTLLTFEGSVALQATTCWALIPPENRQMSDLIYIKFVWEPSDEGRAFFRTGQVDATAIMSNQVDFGIAWKVMHPDFIDDWYPQRKYDPNLQRGFSVSPWIDLSVFQQGFAHLSLYSRRSISGKVLQFYDTWASSPLREESMLSYDNSQGISVPQLMTIAQASLTTVNGVDDGFLFHSSTVETQDFTLTDLVSGLGGILSLVFNAFGIIGGFVLVGFHKWNGFAPYPPYDEREKVRLRRFIRKQIQANSIN